MHNESVNALAHRTAPSLTRRTSLVAIGGAALASALARPAPAHAGKAGKKAKKMCRRQIGQCETSVTAFCATASELLEIDREACEASVLPCCGSFKGCQAGSFFRCFDTGVSSLLPPPE
jgi:hypothetical protein